MDEEVYEIDTVSDLMHAVQQVKTGGYDVDLNVQPNRVRVIPGQLDSPFWLIIEVDTNHPNISGFSGEYWFWADGRVMQVL